MPNIYGMPERETNIVLNETVSKQPYRFFNVDIFGPRAGDPHPGYGSIPYVTAHGKLLDEKQSLDSSLLWMNSAGTWAEIQEPNIQDKRVTFVSESNALELFLFATQTPK